MSPALLVEMIRFMEKSEIEIPATLPGDLVDEAEAVAKIALV